MCPRGNSEGARRLKDLARRRPGWLGTRTPKRAMSTTTALSPGCAGTRNWLPTSLCSPTTIHGQRDRELQAVDAASRSLSRARRRPRNAARGWASMKRRSLLRRPSTAGKGWRSSTKRSRPRYLPVDASSDSSSRHVFRLIQRLRMAAWLGVDSRPGDPPRSTLIGLQSPASATFLNQAARSSAGGFLIVPRHVAIPRQSPGPRAGRHWRCSWRWFCSCALSSSRFH